MYTSKLSGTPSEPRMSIKRRLSGPDSPCKDDDDDEPVFLGTNIGVKNQLSLIDAWGLNRSGETGTANSWKRLRLTQDQEKPFKSSNDIKCVPSTRSAAASSSQVLNLSSSIGSPAPSRSSLFSIESSRGESELSDGFSELDLDFDPSLFPLEVNPVYGIHPSWLEPLKPILTQPETISLHQQLGPKYLGYDYKLGEKPLQRQSEISPAAHDLYNWSRLTPLDRVKVVILGSEPHFRPDKAHGLAFSQPTTCTHISSTIQSIHRELANEYPDKFVRPHHGSLVSWARAGVLLLNIVQTTQRDNEKPHSQFGWQGFTAKILEIVSREGGSFYNNSNNNPSSKSASKGIVFIGWGEQAIQQINSIAVLSSTREHKILTSLGAPCPSSAYKGGFFKTNHFRLANEFLSATYGHQHMIDWWDLQPLDPYSVYY